jgi:hypothetical protein
MFERPHHSLKPIGDLIVGRLETPDTVTLGLKVDEELVTLLGQKTELLFKRREGRVAFSLRKRQPQTILKLIHRRIEPLRCLLQSVRLTHCARPSPLRRRHFSPLALMPSEPAA